MIFSVFVKLLLHPEHTFPKGRENIAEVSGLLFESTDREAKNVGDG